MIHAIRFETHLAGPRHGVADTPDRGVRLHTPMSLLVHVETVLCRQPGRAGHRRSLAVSGTLRFRELQAEVAFCSHRGRGDGASRAGEDRAIATIVPRHFAMKIPHQFLAAPMREETDVWALTPAPDRDPPWREHYAGRLEGEALTFDLHVSIDATLNLTFTPEEHRNGDGAGVNVAGELGFERPIPMRLLVRGREPSTAEPSGSKSDEAVLVAGGARVPIPCQKVSHLASDNPWMTVRVVEVAGHVEMFHAAPVQARNPRLVT